MSETGMRLIHKEIPHWLCVECASIQPWDGEYPTECWSCKGKEFIKDSLPPLYQKSSDTKEPRK